MSTTDEKRAALCKNLDDDFQAFLDEKIKNSSRNVSLATYDKTLDELVEELQQHPAFMTEFDPSKPMSPAMEALQALKYDSDEAQENAESYKEDGNNNFKYKKYRWAIDNYTQGILQKCSDRQLNAVLYSNRAAANFHLGNFRSSYNDSILALKFNSSHIKALIRVIQCSIELKRYDESIAWCDQGILLSPDEKRFAEFRVQAINLQREHEKDLRKQKKNERQKQVDNEKLLNTIVSRGVKLLNRRGEQTTTDLTCIEPENSAGKVHLDDDGILHWPVIFFYPEYGQTDVILDVPETDNFRDHVCYMFGKEEQHPPWDKENKYQPTSISTFFEDKRTCTLIKVNADQPFQHIVTHERFWVTDGVPAFIIFIEDSEFGRKFMSKYKT